MLEFRCLGRDEASVWAQMTFTQMQFAQILLAQVAQMLLLKFRTSV